MQTYQILHIVTDRSVGGAGMLLVSLLSAARDPRFSHTVCLPEDSALLPRLRGLPCTVLPLPLQERSFSLADFFLFYRTLRRLRPSLLETGACLSARLAGRLLGIPTVNLKHCDTEHRLALGMQWASDRVVATSLPLYRHLASHGVPEAKLRCIPNGSPPCPPASAEEKRMLREQLEIGADAPVLCYAARMEPIKAHRLLLVAMRALLPSHPALTVLLLGDGSLRYALEEEARRMGIAAHLRFVGYTAEVAKYLSVTDIALNLSDGSETSSLATSEAMSLGIPVLLSDCEGNRFMAKEGEAGMLFSRGDAQALTAALEHLLSDPALRQELGARGHARYLQYFTAEGMALAYEALYGELLGEIPQKSCNNAQNVIK